MIGLIFLEKIQYDGKKFQTTKINEIFSLMIQEDKMLKKRQNPVIEVLSCKVTTHRIHL